MAIGTPACTDELSRLSGRLPFEYIDEDDILLKLLRCEIGFAMTVDIKPMVVKARRVVGNTRSVVILLLVGRTRLEIRGAIDREQVASMQCDEIYCYTYTDA